MRPSVGAMKIAQEKEFNSKSQEQGQATVELTLLIVVILALVLAFSDKIYKPFGDLTKAYMGDY